MKFQFSVAIGDDQRLYSHLYVIAHSEEHAREIVLQHLADRKPLGLSEAQIRRKNPRRTPMEAGALGPLRARWPSGVRRPQDRSHPGERGRLRVSFLRAEAVDLSRERFLLEERRRAEESLRTLGSIYPALHAVIRAIEELIAKLSGGDRNLPVDVEQRYELWVKEKMQEIRTEHTGAA